MYPLIYEYVKSELPYVTQVRLRKALIILNYLSEQAFEELYFEFMTLSRLEKEELIDKIRLAYKEVK